MVGVQSREVVDRRRSLLSRLQDSELIPKQMGCAKYAARSSATGSSHLGLPQNLALLLQPQNFALLLENLARLLEDHLEALLALGGVLLEALDSKLFDAVPDFLPASAERCDLGSL